MCNYLEKHGKFISSGHDVDGRPYIDCQFEDEADFAAMVVAMAGGKIKEEG
jgi:hypothetical protein